MSELKLFIMRHGEAGDAGPEYPDDSKRPLTLEGEKEVAKIAKGIKKLGLEFDLILSSPYSRASKAAQITAEGLGLTKKLEYTRNLEPGAVFKEFFQELQKAAEKKKCRSVLAVGHEPFLSSLIAGLIAGKTHGGGIQMKKAGLAKVTIEDFSSALLNWLMTPRQLVLLASC